MPSPILLSDAIDEYAGSRRAQGMTLNTLRADQSALRGLLVSVGNIYLRSVEPRHIEAFLSQHPEYKASTRNLVISRVRGFFRWAHRRGYLKQDPTLEFRRQGEPETDRLFVPLERFEEVLDAAQHPRDRMILAIGMYLFLRASEIQGLRVGDVDLARGEIKVTIPKTKGFDIMPICSELDAELRRWLTWYTAEVGKLEPDMFLVPAKAGHRASPGEFGLFRTDEGQPEVVGVQPYRQARRTHTVVQQALGPMGYETHREGNHTFRRSGARALFDALRDEQGTDGALQQVKVMLHHKNVATTERYLGVAPEKVRRDDRLKGRPMFARTKPSGENVVEMRRP